MVVSVKGMERLYDKETELPFVLHKKGKCKCTNDLKEYYKKGVYGETIWLCLCCVMGEQPVLK
jgi:hypothetical protein